VSGLALAVAAVPALIQSPPEPAPPKDGAPPTPPETDKDMPMSIVVESSAFAQNAPIPAKYTGDGDDVSPPLKWSKLPEGVMELALIADDPDAPSPEPWVHWVMYKIPAKASELKENIEKAGQPGDPAGSMQGKNSFGRTGYGGPAPPPGHGLHHYHFKVYALREPLEAKPGLTKKELLELMKGRVLAQGELVGTYERKK
jgi:Raf kinase inhibitor-like YbhB/YbcL family protein